MLKNVDNLNKEYVAPQLEVLFVEMEEGIASGSAHVKQTDNGGNANVSQGWEEGSDDVRTVTW